MRTISQIPAVAMIALSLLLGGCQAARQPVRGPAPTVTVEEDPAWMGLAAPGDIERLKGLGGAWAEALDDARKAGLSSEVAAEGSLLDPGAALARPAPSPGSYKCRVIKLGKSQTRARALTAYKPFFCYVGVEGDLLTLTKQTGTQRPGGYLYDDPVPKRMIFLGSVALGEEDAPLPYGEKNSRDMAGVFERVGSFRYRLVVPRRTGSILDIFELVPSPVQPEE